MSDVALFAVGSVVFFCGGAGVLLALLGQFRNIEAPSDKEST